MTVKTTDQRLEAARSVAAKLEAFHESLTPDEQQKLDVALRSIGAGGGESAEDAAGYSIPVGLLPLIVIKVREVVEQQAGSTQQPSQSAQRH
jgi:hypothetical protein